MLEMILETRDLPLPYECKGGILRIDSAKGWLDGEVLPVTEIFARETRDKYRQAIEALEAAPIGAEYYVVETDDDGMTRHTVFKKQTACTWQVVYED